MELKNYTTSITEGTVDLMNAGENHDDNIFYHQTASGANGITAGGNQGLHVAMQSADTNLDVENTSGTNQG